MLPLMFIFMLVPLVAYAQVADVSIVTDKPQYAIGETIIVNGTLTEYYQDAITIQVLAPNGNLVTIKQIPAELEFQVEISTGGPLMTETGTYDITATHGEGTTTTSFEYGGTPVSNVADQEIPIFAQPELPTQDPNYLLTASVIGAPVPTGEFDNNYALALHAMTLITITLIGIVVLDVMAFALINNKIAGSQVYTKISTKRSYTKRKPITNLDAPL